MDEATWVAAPAWRLHASPSVKLVAVADHSDLIRRRRPNTVAQGSRRRGRSRRRSSRCRRGRANDSDTDVVPWYERSARRPYSRVPGVEIIQGDAVLCNNCVARVTRLNEIESVAVSRYPGLGRRWSADSNA